MPETQLRSLEYEPYEFTYEAREISESSDWNDLIQFGLRKIERFVKSHVIELQIPEELTDGGRYSPEARFIDEISDELDVIEDKKAPLLCELSWVLMSYTEKVGISFWGKTLDLFLMQSDLMSFFHFHSQA